MKIECPGCNLTGNIDDATVPATGLAMTCPRCKKQFTAERPVLQAGAAVAMLDNCPSCQYATFSEEKFAVCPKCGLVVADYHRKLLESRKTEAHRQNAPPLRRIQEEALPVRISEEQKRRDEESRKKYGLDTVPGVVEVDEPVSEVPHVETPLPVFIIGWGTIIVAILLLVYGGSGIYEYLGKVKEAKAAIAALEETDSPVVLFFQFLLFPALSILYALVMLVFAVQFMALKRWYVKAMQDGARAGVVLIALMKVTDMLFWCRRASADASFSYYATGLLGDILMAALWIAPFLVLAEFFKSALYEKIDDFFT